MAPRTRAKARRPSNSLASTQFGELDTTPTSRHLQSPLESNKKNRSPPTRSQKQAVREHEFGSDGLDDDEMMQAVDGASTKLPPSTNAQSYSWSEPDSQTRRSSPLQDDKTQQDIWEFGEDIPMSQFSSNLHDTEALPDTVPLAKPRLTSEPNFHEIPSNQEVSRMVDLSETASTAHRSSPYRPDHIKAMWDLDGDDELELSNPTTDLQNGSGEVFRVPLDNCYDATPPRSITRSDKLKEAELPEKITVSGTETKLDKLPASTLGMDKGKSPELGLLPITPATATKMSTGATDSSSKPQTEKPVVNTSSPAETRNPRKRKQRAKSPLKFDDKTQVIKQHESEASKSPKEPKPRKRVKASAENKKAKKRPPAKGKQSPPAKMPQQKQQIPENKPQKKDRYRLSAVEHEQGLPAKAADRVADADKIPQTIEMEPKVDKKEKEFTNENLILDPETQGSIYVASSPAVFSPGAAHVKDDYTSIEKARTVESPVQPTKQPTTKLIEDSEASRKRLPNMATRTRNKVATMAPQRAPLSSLDPNVISKSVMDTGSAKVTHKVQKSNPDDTSHNKVIRAEKAAPKLLVRTISVSERGSPVRIATNHALDAGHEGSSSSLASFVDSFDLEHVSPSNGSSSSREEVLRRGQRAAERRRVSNGARRLIDYAVASDSSMLEADAATTIPKATRRGPYLPKQRVNGNYFSNRLSQFHLAVTDHNSDDMLPDQREIGRTPDDASSVYQQLHKATEKAIDTLILREQDTKRIAEVYYKNVDNCVDRLHHRFENEQTSLLKECKADGSSFGKLANRGKHVVAEGGHERRALVDAMKKNARNRKQKHEAELASLKSASAKLGIKAL